MSGWSESWPCTRRLGPRAGCACASAAALPRWVPLRPTRLLRNTARAGVCASLPALPEVGGSTAEGGSPGGCHQRACCLLQGPAAQTHPPTTAAPPSLPLTDHTLAKSRVGKAHRFQIRKNPRPCPCTCTHAPCTAPHNGRPPPLWGTSSSSPTTPGQQPASTTRRWPSAGAPRRPASATPTPTQTSVPRPRRHRAAWWRTRAESRAAAAAAVGAAAPRHRPCGREGSRGAGAGGGRPAVMGMMGMVHCSSPVHILHL